MTDTVKFIAFCDPHYSWKSPDVFKQPYLDELRTTIQKVFDFGAKINVDAYLWAGDIFHRKAPSQNPHELVATIASDWRATGKPHYLIGGNHDYKFGTLSKVEGQPLDVLLKTGVGTLLDDNDLTIVKGNTHVRVIGQSYEHTRCDRLLEARKGSEDHLIGLGHFWFGPHTGEFFGEPMFGPETLFESEIDIWVIGHHHQDQGIHEQDGKYISVLGSITRTGAHENDLTRKPAALFIELDGSARTLKAIRPKVTPSDELMDLERHTQQREENKAIDGFIEDLNTAKLTTLDPDAIVTELDVPTEVKERVRQYLSKAEQ